MKKPTFRRCEHCGNLVGMIEETGMPMICCGEKMKELVPNTVDAAREKHVPVITLNGSTVTVNVGSVPHPMIPEHYISWIYLFTEKGGQRKNLKPQDLSEAAFAMTPDDRAIAAYAYCNLHGLWMADVR